ncbi:MAG: hypothetical protein M1827_005732 [Pycnora praestabilis]|nr:MAG: hypothetical protein M1827_005732 [Pycnora praestabilis]
MSKSADVFDGRRRKSTGFFKRPSLSSLTPIHDDNSVEPTMLKKKKRSATFFTSQPSPTGEARESRNISQTPESPRSRPRTLMKNGRPSSLFGSLRSIHSMGEDEEKLTSPISKAPSIDEETIDFGIGGGRLVLHHGEVQTTGGIFKKRKEYLVLTDTHLVRFKSQSRAAEVFSTIPPGLGRSNTMRHTSVPSAGSMQDLQSINSHSSADNNIGIPLHQIVAVYVVEDGKPYFSVEIAHLDEETHQASSMILQLGDPREKDLWIDSIRGAAIKARYAEPTPFPQKSIEYVARTLEQERDYDPTHFKMFKIVQRVSNRSSGRASSDDLAKLSSTILFLVIGVHKVHLIPLPKSFHRTSSTSLSELNSRAAYGFMTLTGLGIKASDDVFELEFRIPLRQPKTLYLASSSSTEIALWIRQATDFLRPEWLDQPFAFHAPYGLEDEIWPNAPSEEDHKSFDRTLIAYCAAYEIDTFNIRYTINYEVEDAPRFELLPPANIRRPKYSILELLALLRALRYNESFSSISFHGIDLDVLHGLRDHYGIDHVPWTSRSGLPLNIEGQERKSLLVHEIQSLALKSKRLRRMDFTSCITRKPQDDESGKRDPGCEITEAIFPLCRKQMTNVDWIILNGIELGDEDLGYLVDAAGEKACHLRALEMARCGLTDRHMQLILNAMLSQDNTMEAINISGNLARLSPSTFQGQMGQFAYIRKINLSRVHRTSGPEPLIAPETLMTWRLDELDLSETKINEQTVDSIATYLASPMSDALRRINLNQCGLTGQDVALFMHAMSRKPGAARILHLLVSENPLELGHSQLAKAVADSLGPSQLTMKMVVYEKENNFRELVQALRKNTTLRYLDISKASLPYDANAETCEALKCMFAENETLEELDMSGEHAHLEVTKFGIGLNDALTGLENNTALKVLRIEYQKLGMQGANTLSTVLQKNRSLREIYCENNDINLQGLTGLINGLTENRSVLYLPSMDGDRKESLQTVEREIQSMRTESKANLSNKQSVRRSLANVGRSSKTTKAGSAAAIPTFTEQDVQAAVRMMNEKWDRQSDRLRYILTRNINLANGDPAPAMHPDFNEGESGRRMSTASLAGVLEKVALQSTPTMEKEVALSDGMDEKYGLDMDDSGEEHVGEKELYI